MIVVQLHSESGPAEYRGETYCRVPAVAVAGGIDRQNGAQRQRCVFGECGHVGECHEVAAHSLPAEARVGFKWISVDAAVASYERFADYAHNLQGIGGRRDGVALCQETVLKLLPVAFVVFHQVNRLQSEQKPGTIIGVFLQFVISDHPPFEAGAGVGTVDS